MGDVEKRKFLALPGLAFRTLGHPARSQSLYRLAFIKHSGACSQDYTMYLVVVDPHVHVMIRVSE
jgi:hypothetical protein